MTVPTLSLPGVTDITATSARPQVTLAYATDPLADLVADLFGNSEKGLLWAAGPDTCFTDTAGTTAAGEDDLVARWADSSGLGINGTQATSANRPVLRRTAGGLWYLEFDGTNDSLTFSAVGISGSRNRTFVFGGSLPIFSLNPTTVAGGTRWTLRNAAGKLRVEIHLSGYTSNLSSSGVLGAEFSGTTLAGNELFNDASTESATGTGAVSTGDNGGNIGGDSVNTYYSGDVYGFVLVDRVLTTTELADAKQFFADRAGVTLT